MNRNLCKYSQFHDTTKSPLGCPLSHDFPDQMRFILTGGTVDQFYGEKVTIDGIHDIPMRSPVIVVISDYDVPKYGKVLLCTVEVLYVSTNRVRLVDFNTGSELYIDFKRIAALYRYTAMIYRDFQEIDEKRRLQFITDTTLRFYHPSIQ